MKTLFVSLILACSLSLANAQQFNNIDKVTTSYLKLKNALTGSNAQLAKSSSKELFAALSLPVTRLKPAQQKLFASYADKLKLDSRYISETSTIDSQRKYFKSLSNNMFDLLSGLKMNRATLYQQYCPMKKASWLSETNEVRNPYYGDDMLECGKVTATLKGK